jgi:hypothetical protein
LPSLEDHLNSLQASRLAIRSSVIQNGNPHPNPARSVPISTELLVTPEMLQINNIA